MCKKIYVSNFWSCTKLKSPHINFQLLMKDPETDVRNVGAFSEPTVNRNRNFISFCSVRLLQDQCNSFTMPHEIIGRCHCGTC